MAASKSSFVSFGEYFRFSFVVVILIDFVMFTVRIDALDNGLALTPPSKSFYVHDHTQLAFDKL